MSVILLSLTVALGLEIFPLPASLEYFRPEWLALALIYWAMALPERAGLLLAWGFGLLLDAATASLLGEHALGLILVVGLILLLHRGIRVLPLPQQAVIVTLLLGIHELVTYWIRGASGHTPPDPALFFAPVATSLLVWPLVFLTLRRMRRRAGLH
mgnify:CR=1 FL=1